MCLPILYSYRRCPYAMRARMALGYAGIEVEIREIAFKNKPQHLLEMSPKGTVPVLVLPNAIVIDESLQIMQWALSQHDPDYWQLNHHPSLNQPASRLIAENDGAFKQALDRYKYADRYPEHSAEFYRSQGALFLNQLEQLLRAHSYLLAHQITVADIAIFPFVRQFAAVDSAWFETADYPVLNTWLSNLINSNIFTEAMQKYPTWQEAKQDIG